MEDQDVLKSKFQNLLKTKSTTFIRKAFMEYCEEQEIPRWNYKSASPTRWHYAKFVNKCRSRITCLLRDGEHSLEVVLRKNGGYYFLIEYDGNRVFECEPDILVFEEERLNIVIEKYNELFNALLE